MHALARLSANVKIAVVLNNTEARGRSRRKGKRDGEKKKDSRRVDWKKSRVGSDFRGIISERPRGQRGGIWRAAVGPARAARYSASAPGINAARDACAYLLARPKIDIRPSRSHSAPANISFGFAYPRENRVIPRDRGGSEALCRFFL